MLDLGRLLQKRGLPEVAPEAGPSSAPQLDEKTVFFLWDRIFREAYGQAGSLKVTPVRYQEGILYLKSQSSLWRNEVAMEKMNLLERLNGQAGHPAVAEIRFSTRS